MAAKDTSPGNASFLMISWVRREYINKWDSSEVELQKVRYAPGAKWIEVLTQRRDMVLGTSSPSPAPGEGRATEQRV